MALFLQPDSLAEDLINVDRFRGNAARAIDTRRKLLSPGGRTHSTDGNGTQQRRPSQSLQPSSHRRYIHGWDVSLPLATGSRVGFGAKRDGQIDVQDTE
jgi:hypothetical protein